MLLAFGNTFRNLGELLIGIHRSDRVVETFNRHFLCFADELVKAVLEDVEAENTRNRDDKTASGRHQGK